MSNVNKYPRETDELQPVKVTVDGVEVTEGVEFALTTGQDRPATWTEPYVVGAKSGVRVHDLAPGMWRVWARVTDSPEVPVIDCGEFFVT